MAKHLNTKDIHAIVSLIRGWQDYKLTWTAICEAAGPLIGKVPTRQSLNAHPAIVEAYKARKDSLKGKAPVERRPASLKSAGDRISHLEAEIAELKEKNRKFQQMFTVWQYNAYKHGIDERHLNQPLPEIDRERSDQQKR
ncbi:hypothetical protein [Idiomarina abyssalis]|uniref:hypothetical protein n=1 Tax=Idiomarina abyssalis TaxID=86102 RepID=UPI0006C8D796|nr:hypothetical protein [Idiomarina abyssalis]KPD21242.1 hypothetical protein ADS78_07795 [Idiomarina abyssalis]SFT71930.1 hypothetical protein SAMN04515657_1908 [Idiomarina abyssalis]